VGWRAILRLCCGPRPQPANATLKGYTFIETFCCPQLQVAGEGKVLYRSVGFIEIERQSVRLSDESEEDRVLKVLHP